MSFLHVSHRIQIPEQDVQESFLRACGPGGQNVNKVETAVQLRFDVRQSPHLPDRVKQRLHELAGYRMTQDGVLVIQAQTYRSQDRNRQEAREKLLALLREAAKPPPPVRRATKPTKGSQERRLDSKGKHAATKRLRQSRPDRDY